jgi:hypothetical protein
MWGSGSLVDRLSHRETHVLTKWSRKNEMAPSETDLLLNLKVSRKIKNKDNMVLTHNFWGAGHSIPTEPTKIGHFQTANHWPQIRQREQHAE